VTGGAGDEGRLELGRLREKVEEFEGNSRGCLPTGGDEQNMAGSDVDSRFRLQGAAALRWTPDDEKRCYTCGLAPRSSRWRPLAPVVNRAGESGKATGGSAPRGGPVRRRTGWARAAAAFRACAASGPDPFIGTGGRARRGTHDTAKAAAEPAGSALV
jgi:hypothetical protein